MAKGMLVRRATPQKEEYEYVSQTWSAVSSATRTITTTKKIIEVLAINTENSSNRTYGVATLHVGGTKVIHRSVYDFGIGAMSISADRLTASAQFSSSAVSIQQMYVLTKK